MDCGPASLKALFGGFGQYLSYGRLREACQTDIDGTSIAMLDEVARRLGLDVEQRMIPRDLLLLESCACLPAIVVVRLAGGATHFVVLWRLHGAWVQVMDPAGGRIWMQRRRFLDSLYIHEQTVAAADWSEWLLSPAFSASLQERLRNIGCRDDIWPDRAHLDAALRLTSALQDSGSVGTRAEALEVLALCKANPAQIPAEYWSGLALEGGREQVRLRGAVLLTALNMQPAAQLEPLPQSLAAIRSEPPPRPWIAVLDTLRADGNWLLAITAAAAILGAAGAVLETLLFLGLLESAEHLRLTSQRAGALVLLVALLGGLLAQEWSISHAVLRLGRRLELRLRARFMLKIPALSDRYFRSRLISDMALRAHALHLLRELPSLAGIFVGSAANLVFTGAAISWLYPQAALLAWIAIAATIAVPLLFKSALVERDLRVREFGAALSRFYLDALLGSRAIQAHCAEQTLQSVHATQLAQWARAGLRQHALFVGAGSAQLAISLVPIVWLVYSLGSLAQSAAGLLLIVYWASSIPAAGRQLASVVLSLPALRNTVARYLELIEAREEIVEAAPPAESRNHGVAVSIESVTAVAGGRVILDGVDLNVAAGEHIAIVGPSGAGKSALLGLLLGWHQAARGRVRVDGLPLDAAALVRLRTHTAWIDPQIHLFQATLLQNLCYGNGSEAGLQLESVIDDAGLLQVLKNLPEGLQSGLGEGGTLISGGEGQRVRIGRALARPAVRLAILDEPARGFDRDARRQLLSSARQRFAAATLLLVTHDVSDTLELDRVVVLEAGRIIEQGAPRQLWASRGSRYRDLLDQDLSARQRIWSHAQWRRVRMTRGVLGRSDAGH